MEEKKKDGERRGSLKQKLKIDLTKVQLAEIMSPRKDVNVEFVQDY